MSTEEMNTLEEALEKHTKEFAAAPPVYTQVNKKWENVPVVANEYGQTGHYHEDNNSTVVNVPFKKGTRGVWFKARGNHLDRSTVTIMEVEATREVTEKGYEVAIGATKLVAA